MEIYNHKSLRKEMKKTRICNIYVCVERFFGVIYGEKGLNLAGFSKKFSVNIAVRICHVRMKESQQCNCFLHLTYVFLWSIHN